MTRSLLGHSPETFAAHAGNLAAEADIPPVLETTDGHTTAQRLNTVVETLADVAEQSGLPRDNDGLYLIGNPRGRYIAVGHEVDVTNSGASADINTLHVVDSSSNLRFYYLGSRVEAGDHSEVDFKVHEEISGITRDAEFSESNGDQLSADAAGVSKQLAETIIDLAVSTHQRGEISDEILSDIVKPLTTPETSHDQTTKVLGSTVVGRLLSKVGIHRAA